MKRYGVLVNQVMGIVIPYLEKDNPEQAAERVVIEST